MTRMLPHGLIVPLITPFYRGSFDQKSMKRLMHSVEKYVDGYAPCLSSGEGEKLSDSEWKEVIQAVKRITKKPIYAGIKRKSMEATVTLAHEAKRLECAGIIIPTQGSSEKKALSRLNEIHNQTTIDILVYSTEDSPITDIKTVKELEKMTRIVGIKDSSTNESLFNSMCRLERSQLSILQGMEHQLLASSGADGFLISLLNTEAALCAKMWKRKTKRINNQILEAFWQQNLGGNWIPSLKATLHERGIILSAEEIKPRIAP